MSALKKLYRKDFTTGFFRPIKYLMDECVPQTAYHKKLKLRIYAPFTSDKDNLVCNYNQESGDVEIWIDFQNKIKEGTHPLVTQLVDEYTVNEKVLFVQWINLNSPYEPLVLNTSTNEDGKAKIEYGKVPINGIVTVFVTE